MMTLGVEGSLAKLKGAGVRLSARFATMLKQGYAWHADRDNQQTGIASDRLRSYRLPDDQN